MIAHACYPWETDVMAGRLILLLTMATLIPAAPCAESKKAEAKPDPKISSIYPFAGQRGTAFDAVIRGSDLAGARVVVFEGSGIEGRILGVETEPAATGEKSGRDAVRMQMKLAADAEIGRRDFRVVTARGVSNKIALDVAGDAVLQKNQASGPLRRFPLIINGRIDRPGEGDTYWIEAGAGETLTF